MKVIVPLPITDDVLFSSSIPEPDTGEIAWISGGSYMVGDRRIRTTTHTIYQCVQDHSGRSEFPENDPLYWIAYRPTNRWAMFDNTVSTASVDSPQLEVVLRPGFFNAVALYGLQGNTLTVQVKQEPGGPVTFLQTYPLIEDSIDWYEWLFTPAKFLSKIVVEGFEPEGDAELTLTIDATTGNAACGAVIVGDARTLNLTGGGTQYGARAEPVDYSYIKTEDDGTTVVKKRHAATDMRVEVFLAQEDADYALQSIVDTLGTPAAWIATNEAGYNGLNVFGLGSASVSYDGPGHAILSINVKGLI